MADPTSWSAPHQHQLGPDGGHNAQQQAPATWVAVPRRRNGFASPQAIRHFSVSLAYAAGRAALIQAVGFTLAIKLLRSFISLGGITARQ